MLKRLIARPVLKSSLPRRAKAFLAPTGVFFGSILFHKYVWSVMHWEKPAVLEADHTGRFFGIQAFAIATQTYLSSVVPSSWIERYSTIPHLMKLVPIWYFVCGTSWMFGAVLWSGGWTRDIGEAYGPFLPWAPKYFE